MDKVILSNSIFFSINKYIKILSDVEMHGCFINELIRVLMSFIEQPCISTITLNRGGQRYLSITRWIKSILINHCLIY